MNVLVMGGSLFNGRSLVHRLVADGHQVTISNRGRTESDLPDNVDRIIADRTDHDATRAALGGREFDAVVDMSGYHPEDVELMIEIFTGNVGHYIFVSSTTIYSSGRRVPTTSPTRSTVVPTRTNMRSTRSWPRTSCSRPIAMTDFRRRSRH